jgi:tRNA threonylcarbamoyladenosine biosynthesis protein TsaB
VTTLFIDTTHFLGVGLLNKNIDQIEYYHLDKQSTHVHEKIRNILAEHNVEINQVENLVTISGPGSYTGMRVSEGISQIFNWQGFKSYSVHHYEIPQILSNEKEYVWISKAFKGEDFLYIADEDKKMRVNSNDLQACLDNLNYKKIYTDINSSAKEDVIYKFEIAETCELIKANFKKLITTILDKELKKPIYYYRSIEEEFKVPKS